MLDLDLDLDLDLLNEPDFLFDLLRDPDFLLFTDRDLFSELDLTNDSGLLRLLKQNCLKLSLVLSKLESKTPLGVWFPLL